jgi:tetratricopeptide (TPR) repeat protein
MRGSGELRDDTENSDESVSIKAGAVQYFIAVSFEQALKKGELDRARAILEELADDPDTGGLWLPECYGDLARSFDHHGRHDEAIAAQERAIELGWGGAPDPRSDIAEFHLRAGRHDEAAAIWAELKSKDPDEVWLYNAAGLSYSEVGEHELALQWLTEGLELALRTGDPEGIAAQMSDVRRKGLEALGRERDDLERRVDDFLPRWRERERSRSPLFDLHEALHDTIPPGDAPRPQGHREDETVPVAMSWFPPGEYERAIERWPGLASDWRGVAHADYSRRMDGHVKWMRKHGVRVEALAPIVIEDYAAWCETHDEDPEEARARYAAHLLAAHEVIDWPPGRNEPCWCGSGRKYKKCCGAAPARPMHEPEA